MAESVVEIIIKVAAPNAQQTVAQVEGALKSLGVTAKTAAASASVMGGELNNIEADLTRVHTALFKTLGALSLIGAGAAAAKAAFDGLKRVIAESIDAVDKFHDQAVSLAAILTDMSKNKGPAVWAQNFAYATSEMNRMHQISAQLGVSWKAMEMAQRAFADIGIAPQTEAEAQAMAQVAKQAQFIAVTRMADLGSVLQIRMLVSGTAAASSQLGEVLRANLGMTSKQLQAWLQMHIAAQDLPQAMARAMGSLNAGAAEVSNSLSVQKTILLDNVDSIQRMAAGGAWSAITNAVKGINDWLSSSWSTIANDLKPAFDEFGQVAAGLILSLKNNWQDWVAAIRVGIGIIEGFINLLQDVVRIIGAISTAWNSVVFVMEKIVGLMDRITHPLGGPTAPVNTAPAAAQAQFAHRGQKGFDQFGNIVGPGTGFPQHAPTQTPPPAAAAGGSSAFKSALDSVNQWVRHMEALAGTIDDAVAREKQLVLITEQAKAKYEAIAVSGKRAADERRQALDKVAELEDQLITKEHNLARLEVTQKIQGANEYLDLLKANNEINLSDQIAFKERELAYDHLTATEKMQIEREIYTLKNELRKQDEAAAKRAAEAEKKATADRLAANEADYQFRREIGTATLSDHIAMLEQELATEKLTSQQILTIRRQIATETISLHKKQAQTQMDSVMQGLDTTKLFAGLKPQTDQQHIADLNDEIAAYRQILAIQASLLPNEQDRAKILEAQRGILTAQVGIYATLMKPITDATSAVTKTIEGAFTQMWDSVLTGSQSFGQALMTFFANIGKSIISQVGQMFAKSLVQSLNLEPMLNKMFGGINGMLGGVGGQADALQAAGLQTSAAQIMLTASMNMITAATAMAGGNAVGTAIGPGGGGFVSSLTTLASGIHGFKDGGVLTRKSLIPFTMAASGGVYSSPTLAMVAEAGSSEAIVPLKGGAIPVDMRAGGGRSSTTNIFAWDTMTGQDQLYRHRDFIAGLHQETLSNNNPAARSGRE